ncbi:hypothetical protein bcgnr5369_01800 [Bacillus cereus]
MLKKQPIQHVNWLFFCYFSHKNLLSIKIEGKVTQKNNGKKLNTT